jgi:hypothetical protein
MTGKMERAARVRKADRRWMEPELGRLPAGHITEL